MSCHVIFDLIYFSLFNSQCGSLHMTSCMPGVSDTGTATGIWFRTFTWPWIRWRAQWPSSGDRLLELSSLPTAWRSWGHLPSSEVRGQLLEHLHFILRWSCWIHADICAMFLDVINIYTWKVLNICYCIYMSVYYMCCILKTLYFMFNSLTNLSKTVVFELSAKSLM